MSYPTERTRLLVDPNPPEYIYNAAISRERKRRVKQFQCCLCALFLSLFSVVLMLTVVYSIRIKSAPNPEDNNTTVEAPVLVLLSYNFSQKQPKEGRLENTTLIAESIQRGRKRLEAKDEIEKSVPSLLVQSPSYRHQRVTATSERARNLSRGGFIEEYASKYLNRNKTSGELVETICRKHTNLLGDHCRTEIPECNVLQRHRTFDGSCNNLAHPDSFGVAYTPFRRILPPEYEDGISKPRQSSLPSARTVSLVVHRPCSRDDPKFSVMLAVWGQFLDHDITATALSQKSNGSTISCCEPSTTASPECFPVIIDPQDPFSEYNVTCMEFVRSAPAATCCLGPREQMNQATAFIDGSVVYSSDESFARKLRTLVGGEMKVFVTPEGGTLLPLSDDPGDGCNREEEESRGRYCFMAGDARANENLHLVSMHLIWVRQHNRLAKNLSRLNPHWDDERTFQEARKITAAQMQHITYNEFLPILLGERLMDKFELSPSKKGYFRKYNDTLAPNIANCFATAAFRFAHSIIPGLMKLLANDSSTPEYVQMHKMLFNPFELYQSDMLDKTLRGAMNASIEASDSYFTDELKSHMFERSVEQAKQPKLCGLDLVSLNIQRGRDHGLPGYVKWRRHCGFERVRNFDDLKGVFDSNSLRNIKAIYRKVEDVDLYTGALSEIPMENSILGPTLTCLLLDQFYRIKRGDRFWYENPGVFEKRQLDELRKTTLAGVICDNADNLDTVQRKVMETIRKGNRYENCSSLGKPDLRHWKESLVHLEMSGGENLHVTSINSTV
ncbi:unnamed protein product [Phyllotreta striolata]|uniref:Chorion peroxidase n=1 Tax=Phyllotreta striolata TaxID=444603 RepID=A0A9N9TVI0_PHYSR|nr:unnamed protein product [Phyllotreta striolata]